MKSFSIIIPAYNEGENLPRLLESIRKADNGPQDYEIIVVDDGSTDATAKIARSSPKVRIISHPKNLGRFAARKTGAEAAKHERLLFVDARAEISPESLSNLLTIEDKAVVGYCLNSDQLTWFEIFYTAIRKKLFARFYHAWGKEIRITLKNFDAYPKGTGIFAIDRKIFLRCLREPDLQNMGADSSDDTKLLRKIAKNCHLLLTPKLAIVYHGRRSFRQSVAHLFYRGAKFVDYYCHPIGKRFWQIIILPFGAFIMILSLGFFLINVGYGLHFLIAILILWTGIALFLNRKASEMIVIFIVIPVALSVYYAGILRGFILKGFQHRR